MQSTQTGLPPHVPAGVAPLDSALGGGFSRGVASLVASRQVAVAYALLLQSTLAALEAGFRVAFVSERLSEQELKRDLTLHAARVNRYRFMAGLAENEDKLAIERARSRLRWDRLAWWGNKSLAVAQMQRQWRSSRPHAIFVDSRPRTIAGVHRGADRFETLMAGCEALAHWARQAGLMVVVRLGLTGQSDSATLADLPGRGRIAAPFATVVLLRAHEGAGGGGRSTSGEHIDVLIPHAYKVAQQDALLTLRFDERFQSLASYVAEH